MRKIVSIISICLLSAAVLGLGALSYWLYTYYESPEELAARARVKELTGELADVNAVLNGEIADKAALQAEYDALTEDLAAKLAEIDDLEHTVDVLLDEDRAADEYQRILLGQISKLKEEAAVTAARIKELDELISNYENITTLNFGYQARKVSDLWIKLAEPNRPTRTIVEEAIDEETGETVVVSETTVPAQLSFHYKDLTTGYTLSYNSGDIMYSASLIKAPYIYSMLKAVTDFEYRKMHFDAEGNPLYDEEGNPLFEGEHPNLDENGRILYGEGEEKYDLSRIWTFDKEKMMKEGSGYIKDMEDGTELTYLELIEYALLYSDNVAFAQLRAMFGYTEYYNTARALGVKGYASGFMQLSADDCGKFMEEIYTFTEENVPYGAMMKEAMMKSNYAVLIPYGVSPTPTAHKYGWDVDAYHDMAIVYNEHPYVLVVMTDLDQGGNTVNAYIHEVVRAINSIHKNFYANK